MKDEIIEELHKFREEFAAKFDFDIDKIYEHLREAQAKSRRKYVSFGNKETRDDESNETRKAA